MARHADDDDAVVFDLVDDEGHRATSPAPPSAEGGSEGERPGEAPDESAAGGGPAPGGPRPAGDPARTAVRRRRTLVGVVVVAAVLGTGLVVDGVRDAARAAQIRSVRGGVVDVSAPLDEVWAWTGAVGSRRAFVQGEGNQVAALGPYLAFETGDGLLALRAATGEEGWTVPLGDDPDCGPTGYLGWSEVATDVLVCLQGSGAEREAFTVGPDGVPSEPRTLDAGDEQRYGYARPGPEGTVLRARRIGPEPADGSGAQCPDEGECSGTVAAGRDLLLRAEDALTGAERWSVVIPFRAMAAEGCRAGPHLPWDRADDIVRSGEHLDPEGFGARIEPGLVQVWGCGFRAGVTADGALLMMEGVPGFASVAGLDTGGYVAQTIAQRYDGRMDSALYSPDGEAVRKVAGTLNRPQTTDDPGAATLLSTEPPGGRLRSYAADGTERWDVAVRDGTAQFLAQVDRTVVTTTWAGGVRGLDLDSGAARWTWRTQGSLYDWSYESSYVSQAFTDGQSLLMLLESGSGDQGLVSLDVASGELVWDGTSSHLLTQKPDTMLLAVDGNLLEVSQTGVRRLG
ncbi:PQQ-binding-like beta-propeller repeat protein [Promicromonospora sp. NPDC019610]|uniref:outer membrane protein assembly factor BamB family protein n=1 Tax=Promicromonospora sp. NPDC019610 TaxID=3364405 RepID=UPI00379C7538